MSKVGRNEPCPCGSGKKYKRCCGKSNVIQFQAPHLDNELEKIHEELIDFAVTHYEREIDEVIHDLIEENIMNEEESDIETYANLLIAWIILFEPIIGNKTVLEIFSEQTINKVKQVRVQRAFAKWEHAISAVFEIKSLNQKDSDMIIAENIFTGKTHHIKHETPQTLHVGDYMIGTLAPFIHNEQFIFVVSLIRADLKPALDNLLEIYDPKMERMTELFPDWLGELIDPDEDEGELTWLEFEHKRVAEIYEENMLQDNVDPRVIEAGLYFWNIYCIRNNPYVPKATTYAAGLHYLIINVLTDNRVTQAKIAKRYKVSPATVSTRYQSFIKEFDTIFEEHIEEVDPVKSAMEYQGVNLLEKEGLIANLYNELIKHEFDSEEDLKEFLDNIDLNALPTDTPEMIVGDLIIEASQTWGKERKQLIDRILKLDPNNVDAYILLADMETEVEKRHDLLTKAVQLGEENLGSEFFKQNKGHFWGLIETRPYMRALADLADLLYAMGQEKEAIKMYEKLIELNPNDNQGIRDELMPIYIETRSYNAGLKLFKQYSEYPDTYFLYSRALIEILMHGVTETAKSWLRKAIESNEHVVDYLLGRKRIPNEVPQYFQPGADSEAVIYAQRNFHLWKDNTKVFRNL